MLDQGEVCRQDARRIVILVDGSKVMRAVIQVDEARNRLYLLTLFETSQRHADAEVRNRLQRLS